MAEKPEDLLRRAIDLARLTAKTAADVSAFLERYELSMVREVPLPPHLAELADAKTLKRAMAGQPLVMPPLGYPKTVAEGLNGVPEKPAKAAKADKLTQEQKILRALGTYGPLTKHQIYYYEGVSPVSATSREVYEGLVSDGDIAVVDRSTFRFVNLEAIGGMLLQREQPEKVFQRFLARLPDQVQKLLQALHIDLLQAHHMDASKTYQKHTLCDMARVSRTSETTRKAFERIATLGIADVSRGTITFEDWYLKTKEPTVSVFDTKSGETRQHDVKTGKAL